VQADKQLSKAVKTQKDSNSFVSTALERSLTATGRLLWSYLSVILVVSFLLDTSNIEVRACSFSSCYAHSDIEASAWFSFHFFPFSFVQVCWINGSLCHRPLYLLPLSCPREKLHAVLALFTMFYIRHIKNRTVGRGLIVLLFGVSFISGMTVGQRMHHNALF